MGWYHAMIAEGQNAFEETKSCGCGSPPPLDETSISIYHMTRKSEWEQAKSEGKPYYASTYKEAGNITRASVDSEALLKIANIAYKKVPGDWVCIAMDRKALVDQGVDTRVEPCDEKGGVGESCRQIHGGIPTNNEKVVTGVFLMTRLRDDGTFISINGLTNKDSENKSSEVSKQELLRYFL